MINRGICRTWKETWQSVAEKKQSPKWCFAWASVKKKREKKKHKKLLNRWDDPSNLSGKMDWNLQWCLSEGSGVMVGFYFPPFACLHFTFYNGHVFLCFL